MRIDPGSALDEVALAKTYEVSRTSVREALLLLANEGFVQFLQNRTSIVAPLSMHNQAAFLDTYILLSRGLIRAATSHGGADRALSETLVRDCATGLAAGDVEAAFRAQLDLFRHIAAQTKNRFLENYFLEIQDAPARIKLLYFCAHLSAADRAGAELMLTAVVVAMVAGEVEASDTAVCDAILFEHRVIQNGLGPRYAHLMILDH